jgi:hypothetical protein
MKKLILILILLLVPSVAFAVTVPSYGNDNMAECSEIAADCISSTVGCASTNPNYYLAYSSDVIFAGDTDFDPYCFSCINQVLELRPSLGFHTADAGDVWLDIDIDTISTAADNTSLWDETAWNTTNSVYSVTAPFVAGNVTITPTLDLAAYGTAKHYVWRARACNDAACAGSNDSDWLYSGNIWNYGTGSYGTEAYKAFGYPATFVTGENGKMLAMGNVSSTSAQMQVMTPYTVDAYVEYGTTTAYGTHNDQDDQTGVIRFTLSPLAANTLYYYRIQYRTHGNGAYTAGETGSFRTAKAAGTGFEFTVIADSHLRGGWYAGGLSTFYAGYLAGTDYTNSDFVVLLGDELDYQNIVAFTTRQLQAEYIRMQQYLSEFHKPVFALVGNHETCSAYQGDPTMTTDNLWLTNSLCAWSRTFLFADSCAARKDNLLVDTTQETTGGSYFDWVWGDVHFIALSPYIASTVIPRGCDTAGLTLGTTQYNWYINKVNTSSSKYIIVLIHQELQGAGTAAYCRYGRGGVSTAGKLNNSELFGPLAAKTNAIIIKGHDHFFADEDYGVTKVITTPALWWTFCDGSEGSYDDWAYSAADVVPCQMAETSQSGVLQVSVSGLGVRGWMLDKSGVRVPNTDWYSNDYKKVSIKSTFEVHGNITLH